MYKQAMDILMKLPHQDLSDIQAFADHEDTLRGLSLLALAHLQEKEDRAKRQVAEEDTDVEEACRENKRATMTQDTEPSMIVGSGFQEISRVRFRVPGEV